MNSMVRTGTLLGLAFGAAVLLAKDDVTHSHVAVTGEPSRADGTTAHALWPGAFVVREGQSSRYALFEATGRRYVGEVRSDGFLVRRGLRRERALGIQFVDARQGAGAVVSRPLAGRLSVMGAAGTGEGTSRWLRYGEATFRDVYPGIAARYRETDGDLELDFLVAAGADPRLIELAAAQDTRFDVDPATGDVLVIRDDERFRLKRPRAFQPGDDGLTEVPVRAIAGRHSLRFDVGRYDPTRPLVIDPLVATWSTFVGTNTDAMYDRATALATDGAGNLYVAGLTQFSVVAQATDSFPTTPGSLTPANPRSPGDTCAYQCGYVLKLSPSHQVIYGALIYGLTMNAIAVDAAGAAYVTGTTLDGTNFPSTPGAFDTDPAGQAFVSKIVPDGSAFAYSAIFPADSGTGIAVDPQGNAYVVGTVSVPNLPTTPGSIKPSNPVGATINQDAFLLKVNANGSALVYGTYLGGSGADSASAVQVNGAGEAVVVGTTASSDFTGLAATVSGASDSFLIRVSSDGSRIVAGQVFGGSANDNANAVAPDGSGGWVVCGDTTSSDLPTTVGALQTHLLGQRNGWVRRVDAGFNAMYSTYFGGSALDGCLGVAADAQGTAYLVGVTFSADLPLSQGAFQDRTSAVVTDYFAGLSSQFYSTGLMNDRESYFAALSETGALLYGTFLGGYLTSPRDYPPLSMGTGVVVVPDGTVYVSGSTTAASFPVTDGGLRSGMGGEADGFIVSFANSTLAVTTPSLLPTAPLQMPYQLQLQATGGTPPYSWSLVGFSLPDGISLSPTGMLSGAAANPQTEHTGYQFTVKATDAAGHFAYKSLFLDIGWPGNFICTDNTCLGTLATGVQLAYQIPVLARGIAPESGVVSGQLPPGITLSSSGSLTGAPTQTGEYRSTFTITDASGQSATFNLDFMVESSAVPNASLTASPSTVSAGQSFTLNWASYYTTGCVASGGGASGSPWSGNLPVFGSTTQAGTVAGTYTYTVSCPSGGASPVVATTQVVVSSSSSSGGGGGSGGGGSGGAGGNGGGGGGGGGVTPIDVTLLTLLVLQRGAQARRRSRAATQALT
ncbi:MAG: SBBP repeat-containing protein [Proteobacteria bacterium]|nr:SBBP repeat-containing protein [Pseudomonadota bacterium]